jgi:hypothetical protein
MGLELCPRCRGLRNMRVTTDRRKVVDAKGKTKVILTRIFHCETCNSFVRSEDLGKREC